MTPFNRRRFLEYLGSAAATTGFMDSIARARAVPAHSPTGTIDDVQHVVFLMQENRAFDHYFGSLRGVRGFGDPHPARLPSGKPVWYQPNGDGFVLPYHPPVDDFGMRYLTDTPHYWNDTQAAWNGGKYDRWVPNKSPQTMTYYTRQDIPFHYALADAFTICDSYHCSLLGSTDPNRYHMWTGWVGNDGRGGGPVIDNAELGYGWTTYPERLERAGVSWKIYQDSGFGLDAAGGWGDKDDPCVGNYGDNSLLLQPVSERTARSAALRKARRGTNIAAPGASFDALFDDLRQDVRESRLPQVSWIVAPEAFSEHGNWPANHGAWYISRVLDALTSNPEVWSRTALFVMYDENDGFFDHVIPPTPPRWAADGGSTVDASNEIFPGNADYPSGPYGLGVRVPMIVVSPWSKGGWVSLRGFRPHLVDPFPRATFAPRHPELIETNITSGAEPCAAI
jgi:phospholipase C